MKKMHCIGRENSKKINIKSNKKKKERKKKVESWNLKKLASH
jgi:hypothetical protein